MDLFAEAITPVVLVGITAIVVFETVKADHRKGQRRCICGCKLRRHVSAWDWDSDYGDPQHIGPNYVKPGTCRDCRCRSFIAAGPIPS